MGVRGAWVGSLQSQESVNGKEKAGSIILFPFLPSCPTGLNDWDDDEILASVLAVSQQEYLDSMKKNKVHRDPPPDKS